MHTRLCQETAWLDPANLALLHPPLPLLLQASATLTDRQKVLAELFDNKPVAFGAAPRIVYFAVRGQKRYKHQEGGYA